MMWSSLTSVLLLALPVALAQSPPGVYPQVTGGLIAGFGDRMVGGGDVLTPDAVTGLPQIGLAANQSQAGNRYLLMIVDLDYNGQKRKRQEFTLDEDSQPEDAAHAGGQGTFLHALVQDYQVSSSAFGDNGKMLQQSGTPPAGYMAPSPSAGNNHRYMMLLFDQPLNFKVPTSVQQLVSLRTNFNIRNFIAQSNLALPRHGTWFIVAGGSGSGGSAPSSPSGVNVDQSVASSTPTSTSTGVFFTTSTLPNGGPTLTYQYTTLIGATPGSTASGSAATTTAAPQGGSQTTLTYMTTMTLPNGGPTATFLTTSVAPITGGEVCVFNSANICRSDITTYYTTGFLGFTVLSSFSVSSFVTTTLANGQLTAYRTASTRTWTRAFSGVSHISLSTYVASETLTTTGTAYINSQLTTFTSTSVSVGTTTSAAPAVFTGAAAPVQGPQRFVAPAVLAVAGAALAVL